MNDIRIFMCYHKMYGVVPPLCEPIKCGAALNGESAETLTDSGGENISYKNREYCELTAHYFAWKNIDAKYYGFCHYRRFFCAEDYEKPYLVMGKPSQKNLIALLKDNGYWRIMIKKYEIIAPKSEDMGLPAREHYNGSPFHRAEDLNIFMDVLYEKTPWLIKNAEEYLSKNRQYFCNMFIMDKKHFFEYCEWLFGILSDFDKRKVLHGDYCWDRTDGYLGELFTGIYLNYCAENGVKIKELTRLDAYCTLKKRLICALLPAESRRRFFIKKLVGTIKGNR